MIAHSVWFVKIIRYNIKVIAKDAAATNFAKEMRYNMLRKNSSARNGQAAHIQKKG